MFVESSLTFPFAFQAGESDEGSGVTVSERIACCCRDDRIDAVQMAQRREGQLGSASRVESCCTTSRPHPLFEFLLLLAGVYVFPVSWVDAL